MSSVYVCLYVSICSLTYLKNYMFKLQIFIQLEARLQPNIGFTLRRVSKWWRSRVYLELRRKWTDSFLSVKQRTISPIFRRPNFTKFKHLNTIRRSVSWCKLSEQNFENFTARGHFSKKTQKFLNNFQRLVTSGRHNSAMITDRR